jgi:hypothetical protein
MCGFVFVAELARLTALHNGSTYQKHTLPQLLRVQRTRTECALEERCRGCLIPMCGCVSCYSLCSYARAACSSDHNRPCQYASTWLLG